MRLNALPVIRRASLRWQLVALFCLGTFVLVVDRALDISDRRDELVELGRQRLLGLARESADRQAGVVASVRTLLTLAVEMPETASASGEACRTPFAQVADAIPWLTSLAVARSDGSLFCSSNATSSAVNLVDRSYFQQALRSRGFALSDFTISRVSAQPTVLAAMPRIVSGEIDSVVVASLDLDWFSALVTRIGERSGTDIVLSDTSGTIVSAYPDGEKRVGRPESDFGLRRGRGVFTETVGADGLPRVYAQVELAHTGGSLWVGTTRAALLEPAERTTLGAAATFTLAFMAALGILLLMGEHRIVRPLRRLAGVSARLGEGELSARAGSKQPSPEFAELAQAFNRMADRLARRDAELRGVNEHLARLATADPLTGVGNRRLFDERLAQEWRRAVRTERPLGLLVIDVDCFKAFNDTRGHPEGDVALRAVAAVIEAERRPSDLAARIGGEEFALLLPGADGHRAMHLARLIRLGVEALAIPHARSPAGHLTVSVGAASLVATAETSAGDLVRIADEALYEAKRGGRNRIGDATRLAS